MDKFTQLNQILDGCLTIDLIEQLPLPNQPIQGKGQTDPSMMEKNRSVQIQCVRTVASIVESKLDRELSSDEIPVVCQRVDKFLLGHGIAVESNFN